MREYALNNGLEKKYNDAVLKNSNNIFQGKLEYNDPDYGIEKEIVINKKTKETIRLSPDRICGITYLRKNYEFKADNEKLAEAYKIIRSKIILWPKHRQSINQRRYACYRDRIDFTLFDISQFYSSNLNPDKRSSRLVREGSDSARYLNEIGDFKSFIKEYELENFIKEGTIEVYNLSRKDGKTIISDEKYAFSDDINKTYLNNLINKLI